MARILIAPAILLPWLRPGRDRDAV